VEVGQQHLLLEKVEGTSVLRQSHVFLRVRRQKDALEIKVRIEHGF
jgi:hypothetical protein